MEITLLKAAEILDFNVREAGSKMTPDVKDAVIKGKEALERLDGMRKKGMAAAIKLLPSEISGPR
jgi:hypothetical protein